MTRPFASRPNEAPLPDPLAYLLTWTTYGTWLPGNARGWTDKNKGKQPPDAAREAAARRRMTESACVLADEQRRLVEATIAEHCRRRRWELHAVNCRTNHVHVVVAAPLDPKRVRNTIHDLVYAEVAGIAAANGNRRRTGARKLLDRAWQRTVSQR